MDLVKKKKIKTLNELNTFDENKVEIQRQLRMLGLQEPTIDRFEREMYELQREHTCRMNRIKRTQRIIWLCFTLGFGLQLILLILKLLK
jgi:hypothetical protein